jgi:5-methylcytosine-specific restriction enzyme A
VEASVAITYDVASDFAVLCANCHRMIHRSDDPSDLLGIIDLEPAETQGFG